jgi:hypothetical protein
MVANHGATIAAPVVLGEGLVIMDPRPKAKVLDFPAIDIMYRSI